MAPERDDEGSAATLRSKAASALRGAELALPAWVAASSGERARVLARAGDELLAAGEALVRARTREGRPAFEVVAHELAPLAGLCRRVARALSEEGAAYDAPRLRLLQSRTVHVELEGGALVAAVSDGLDGLVGALGAAVGALAAGHAALLCVPAALVGSVTLARGALARAGVPEALVPVLGLRSVPLDDDALAALAAAGVERWLVVGDALAPGVAPRGPVARWSGGGAYALVAAGADVERAASAIARGATAHGGYGLLSLRAVLVRASLRDALMASLQARLASTHCAAVGAALEPDGAACFLGAPSRAAHDEAAALVDALVEAGCAVRAGGLAVARDDAGDDAGDDASAVTRPVLLEAPLALVRRASRARACVLTVASVDDEHEALRAARAWGDEPPCVSVFARDEREAYALARSAPGGTVFLNDAPYARVGDAPLALTRPSAGDQGASDPVLGASVQSRVYVGSAALDVRVPCPWPAGGSAWRLALRALRITEGAAGWLGALTDPY